MANIKEKAKNLYKKLRTIKNIEIIIALVIISIAVLIYFSIEAKKDNQTPAIENNVSSETSLTEGLEERLANILTEIEGAGEVRVMITYETTAEIVTADKVDTHTTTSGVGDSTVTNTTSNSVPIIVTGTDGSEVIVLQEKMPRIKGVIIVAEGAGDVAVKMRLMSATSTVLGVNANSIQIFTRRDV